LEAAAAELASDRTVRVLLVVDHDVEELGEAEHLADDRPRHDRAAADRIRCAEQRRTEQVDGVARVLRNACLALVDVPGDDRRGNVRPADGRAAASRRSRGTAPLRGDREYTPKQWAGTH